MRALVIGFVCAACAVQHVGDAPDAGRVVDANVDRADADAMTASQCATTKWSACNPNTDPNTFAPCQLGPVALATDDANVYWTNVGHYLASTNSPPLGGVGGINGTPCGDGSVSKCSKEGCAATALFTGGTPTELVTLGTDLVFSRAVNDGIELDRCAKTGCTTPETLVATWAGRRIQSDGASLYFAMPTGLMTCTLPCSTTSQLWSGAVTDLRVDASSIVFAENELIGRQWHRRLMECDKVSCSTPNLLADVTNWLGPPGGLELATDDVNVYFGTSAGIGVCPKSGCNGAPAVFLKLPNDGSAFITGLAADGSHVYWTEFTASSTFVASCPVGGCTSPTVVASEPYPGRVLASLILDATRVYWLESDGDEYENIESVLK